MQGIDDQTQAGWRPALLYTVRSLPAAILVQVFEVVLSRMTNDLDEIEYALSDALTHSFSAPHISGLVAKVLAKHPGLTPFQVKTILYATARNVYNRTRKGCSQLMIGLFAWQPGKEFYHGRSASIHIFGR